MYITKKDGTKEEFNPQKIINAIRKSAERVMVTLNARQEIAITTYVKNQAEALLSVSSTPDLTVDMMHNLVEGALKHFGLDEVRESYMGYRNYKKDFVAILDETFKASQSILFLGDRDNANTDSSLVATRRCLVFNELNKRLYRKFFMNTAELEACNKGYIYVHDQSARRDTMNCCLFRVGLVMRGGFEMGNQWYNEPKSLDVAFDVLGDIILSTASQQYGGFTVPEVDKVLAYYAQKSYDFYYNEALTRYKEALELVLELSVFPIKKEENLLEAYDKKANEKAHEYAMMKVEREYEQGFQGIEMKLNTVGSSRGDYPFITMTFGLGTEVFERLASATFLRVHMKGQGKKGHKKLVLFPKIVFLFDEELHGEGCINNDLFELAIDCSCKTMYPDYLSLTGDGYVASMYKKYKKVISPMGCRAFLSPWYERGGMTPADEEDVPVFEGRFNIGAVSLNLPMIYEKAKKENKPFHEVLDYYLEMIRNLHLRTYDYLGEMKASTNPVAYCEGGFYGGNLKPNDKIKPLLDSATASFGITALNELQQLHNHKSITEDGEFALETLKYINEKVEQFKWEDKRLYAIYGTPAESLCGLQVEQFRKEYGIIENVSDRPYVSNSFHCHVSEDITPFQKQDLEYRFWDLSNGGKIQYNRYKLGYNRQAVKTGVLRAMGMGLYEGVNINKCYCEDCGYESEDMKHECFNCGSHNITIVDRMNGYLGFTRIYGDTRYNEAKNAEIEDRVSM